MNRREPLPQSSERKNRLLALGVLALYVIATIAMTWPVVVHLGTRAAGSGNDMWVSRWNNWWLRKALVEGKDPYYTLYLFYPQGVSLLWHSFSWLNTALWLPLQSILGALAAQNVIILSSYVPVSYTHLTLPTN